MTAKAALVIPEYNEGERVLEVISAAKNCGAIQEVVVVDDGSTDDSPAILETVEGITVLTHPHNRGKGEALDTGVRFCRDLCCENVVFLDADLRGIEAEHIDDLLTPLDEGAPMTIGYLGLRRAVVKRTVLQQWGALSGQRALKTDLWSLLNTRDKHGFNIEAALNARVRKQKLHRGIARVALDGVGHVGKRVKDGSIARALWGYTKTYSAAFGTYARIEMGG